MPEPEGSPSPPAEPRRVAGGFTVPEYEERVWDMAKHQLHPAGLWVLASVAGLTRILPHARLSAPGGTWIELGAFACLFLGAWACFYSTLLRVAGLPSLTVTLLVPFATGTAIVVWTVLPPPAGMSETAFWSAAAALTIPGPAAFAVTLRRWRAHRRANLHLLPEADR